MIHYQVHQNVLQKQFYQLLLRLDSEINRTINFTASFALKVYTGSIDGKMYKKDSSSIETSIQAYRAILQGQAEGANRFN